MSKLIFDIECNGLYQEATKVWCICIKDAVSEDTPERPQEPVRAYFDITPTMGIELRESRLGTLREGLRYLQEADILVGHNIINYDLPVLKKLLDWEPNYETTHIHDTLVLSRLLNPDRTRPSGYTGKGGPHSLEAWGYRTSKSKPHHEEWDVFSSAMLRRCIEDVEINYLTDLALELEVVGWDWGEAIKLEHSIAKIITDQEHFGVTFDKKRAIECIDYLTDKIDLIDKEVIPKLPHKVKQRGATVLSPFTMKGEYTKKYREDISYCDGPFTRIDFISFEVGSIPQVKKYLLDNGWIPDEWNYSKKTGERSSPKLEGDFKGVTGNLPQQIKKRIILRHRRSQIEGWIRAIRLDGKIGAIANPCGTNTGRMRHSVIVNVPKANSDDKGNLIWEVDEQRDFFGTQMRSLFIVPKRHYKMVGYDAKGLELRILAHYMNDLEFTKEILDGDIHTYNQRAAGLPTRDAAKTFIYAFIYGAGDAKLGSIVGGDRSDGSRIRKKFLKALPRLDHLVKRTKKESTKGYLVGLDNRKIWMRYNEDGRVMEHKALNTLLQCGGSLVMKKSSSLLWDEYVPANNLKAYKIIDMHDESQAQVLNSSVELYSELAVKSIQEAGKYFNLSIPMDADVKVGLNWAMCH